MLVSRDLFCGSGDAWVVGRVHRKSRRRRSVGIKGYIRKHYSGYLRKNPFRARLKKNSFCVQLVRPSVFHQGGWVGWRVVWERSEWRRSWWERSGCGPQFRPVFPLPTIFFVFFQIPRYFVEFRWSLRVFIIESVFRTHIWSSLDILCRGGLYKLKF